MRRFTVDVERTLEIEAPNERHAVLIADAIDSAVDRAIRERQPEHDVLHARTQAYRGVNGGCIYDSQDESVRP